MALRIPSQPTARRLRPMTPCSIVTVLLGTVAASVAGGSEVSPGPEAPADDTGLAIPWSGRTPRDLHQEYNTIFKHGNRNAASHLWSSFLLDRAAGLAEATFLEIATGYCAVSGSPVGQRDGTRYKMRLDHVDGTGAVEGFMYYCCWPCVCDTQDFIKVDTKTVATADGPRQHHFAVLGNPCDHPDQLDVPWHDPFGRGETTISQQAREVRCGPNGELIGATLSDHGFVILTMFFNSTDSTLKYQDERTYEGMCEDRKSAGYNSGMGEIFRKVAAIAPVPVAALDMADPDPEPEPVPVPVPVPEPESSSEPGHEEL